MDDKPGSTPTINITDAALQGGRTQLTVRDGDEILHIDQLRVGKYTEREAFIAKLIEKYEGLASLRDGIEVNLLKIAARAANHEEKPADDEPKDSPEAQAAALEMLQSPDLFKHILDDIAATGVAGEEVLVGTLYLIGTSRLLDKPLAGIVQGLTSSGKSYAVDRVAALFPSESVIRAHKMTPEALVHMPPGRLVHKFVVGGERSLKQDDDNAEATRALREMLSDGNLTKLMPTKTGNGIETIEIHQEGPIAYVESTTQNDIRDEDRNRCLVLSTDETPAQTRRIIQLAASRRLRAAESGDRSDIVQKHHAAQRRLHRCYVVVPFADRLAETFPHERTDSRRSFPHVLSMIEAVCILHQYQRTETPCDESIITATREDYEIARHLLAGPLGRSMGDGLSDAARRFLERLEAHYNPGETFDSRTVQQHETIIRDPQTVRRHLRALEDAGRLDIVERNRGRKPATYRLLSNALQADSGGSWLPTPDAVFGDADGTPPESRRVKAQSDEAPGVETRQEDQPVSGAATPQAG